MTVYFYNPNIHPAEEHDRREAELVKFCSANNIPFVKAGYEPLTWFSLIKGLEREPERGQRCLVCFKMRLIGTAEFARENGFDFFTTTLSISPYKDSKQIFEAGEAAARETGIEFLAKDWKADDGFRCSCVLSKKEGFYRQKYCGCVYSRLVRPFLNN